MAGGFLVCILCKYGIYQDCGYPHKHTLIAPAVVGTLVDTVLNMTLGDYTDLGEPTAARCDVIASACDADMFF